MQWKPSIKLFSWTILDSQLNSELSGRIYELHYFYRVLLVFLKGAGLELPAQEHQKHPLEIVQFVYPTRHSWCLGLQNFPLWWHLSNARMLWFVLRTHHITVRNAKRKSQKWWMQDGCKKEESRWINYKHQEVDFGSSAIASIVHSLRICSGASSE